MEKHHHHHASLLEDALKVQDAHFSGIPIMFVLICLPLSALNKFASDLENANSPDFNLRRKIADDIRRACLTVGFFYIKVIMRFLPIGAQIYDIYLIESRYTRNPC